MPLQPGDGEQEFGDDYSEPPFSPEPQPEPEPQQPPDPGEQETPVGEYVPYDLSMARPSARFDPVDERGTLRLVDEEGNALPSFDPKYHEDFHGLAFIGALSKTFEWLGHKFTIRTVTVDEALAVALLTKQWAETIGGGLAYRTAMAAMCVQAIDGSDLPIPVGADPNDFAYAQQRFDYAKARWFQFTIDAIYNEYLELELKTRQVVDAMGKASGQTALTTG